MKTKIRIKLLTLKSNILFKLNDLKFTLKKQIRISWNKLTKKSKLGLSLPKSILLGATQFSIQEHEGLIVFSEKTTFYGCHQRISFSKHGKYSCWYVELSSTWNNRMMPCKIYEAYKLVCDYRGDSFGQDMAINGSL